ncbi:MAG: DUF302 domain-containing protein [Parvularculaceae bacterium]|nr:DUF302 domain-containing protein [Parvularculaceae bacterium]
MRALIALVFFAGLAACAHAAPQPAVAPAFDGLIAVDSVHSFDDTVARLEAALAARQLKTFKIDHAANAAGAGLTLRPTALYIFGNPKGGTPLMEIAPTAGVDLPLKVLVVEEGGRTRLVYNDIDYIARRHAIPADAGPLATIARLLAEVAAEAAGR